MEVIAAVFIAAACWHLLVWAGLRRAGHPRSAAVLRALAHAESELMDELRRRAEGAEAGTETHPG